MLLMLGRLPLSFLISLLMLWSTADLSPTAGAAAAMAQAVPVRVGVVLDLRSDVGRKRRDCIFKALHEFDVKHPSYAGGVELRVIDSGGDLATAAHAAEYLIKNSQAQAIIWGPQTLNKAGDFLHLGRHHSDIPIIAFSGISPTTCAFWTKDRVTNFGGPPKFGFALGSEIIIFLNLKTDGRHHRKLYTRRRMQDCKSKRKLRIAVPNDSGFEVFVNVIDPISKKQNVTGYSIDIFKAAIRNLHPRPCYKFIIFDGTYDELVGNVSLGVYDAAVGDVTITAERVTRADFTMPYTQSGVSMLVLAGDEPNTIRWTFVKPLNGRLWLATMVFFFYTGFVVWMIELPRNQEYQGSSLRQCSTALYFSFSTLTFSHGGSIRSPLSKIVVVIWCFVVLILVQSYTASLSSMLTAKRLRPWVTDLEQLRHNGDFVGYQGASFVRSFLLNHNFSESRLRSYITKDEYAAALRSGSNNGGVSAIVDEIPYLTSLLSDRRYKNDFRMLGCIYKTAGFGFAFRQGSPLVHNISVAILNLTGGNEGSQIEVKWFGTSSLPITDSMVPDTDSAPLTLQSFSGLFVITGSISTLMLLISIGRLVYAKCTSLGKADMESGTYSVVDEVQDGMGDNLGADQQPLGVADNDDFQEVYVNGENAQDGAPEPVQQTGMHGSVPVYHIHIDTEMSTV